MLAIELYILILAVSGILAGLIAGIIGLGGGGVFVPLILILAPHMAIPKSIAMHVAVATSLSLIVPTNIAAGIKHIKLKNYIISLLFSSIKTDNLN